MNEPKPPVLRNPIPSQVINEGASFTLDLSKFIYSENVESGAVHFTGELASGASLPQGLICTSDGLLTGIPAKDTQGAYEVVIMAENESRIPLAAQFALTIRPRMEIEGAVFNEIKAKVWEALGKNLPIPDIGDILNRPVTANEVYYLLQRFAFLTIWDVYNLDLPGEKVAITLEGASPHYAIYDRGSCLVASPKELFSSERTLEDALQTARALAREVYQRGWTIEFGGFNKMARAAWIELQILADKHGKGLDILHYTPSPDDLKIYVAQSRVAGLGL